MPEPSPPSPDLEGQVHQLRDELHELEARLREQKAREPWWPERFYLAYHVLMGAILGLAAASASLLFNVIGSLMVDQHPLQLIRVFLTFPLGEEALQMDNGFTLSAGCFLYLGAGMFFGALIHVIVVRFFEKSAFLTRLFVAGTVGLVLWLVNFYGILSWLQPLLFDGQWMLSEIPPWVAAATHLVFAWTVVVFSGLARFEPLPPAALESPETVD